jgi:hypothetical protein
MVKESRKRQAVWGSGILGFGSWRRSDNGCEQQRTRERGPMAEGTQQGNGDMMALLQTGSPWAVLAMCVLW